MCSLFTVLFSYGLIFSVRLRSVEPEVGPNDI